MKKLYFLLLTLIAASASAQYTFTAYNPVNSAILGNNINDIKTDANGLLWIATYFGVSTFNGTTFTNYTTENSAIASNTIKKIEIDGLGRKWMATTQNGIILLNGSTWSSYTVSNSSLPSNVINDIAVDSANNLWIATPSELTKFNGTTWTTYTAVTEINTVATDGTGIWVTNNFFGVLYKFNGADYDVITQGVSKILKIANSVIYCSTGDALATLTTGGTYLNTQYQGNSCLSGYQFNGLDVDSNNKVWIAFNGTGLQNFTDCTSYTFANSDLPEDFITVVRPRHPVLSGLERLKADWLK
ncbi:two-component regulator propeller domain-containing protein [Flavobacterium sp. 3HN19-14]|uniref:two-component regulator propeller domain-containing protein n=1 Tax=Flavobacterium sp. 3HN19-14 TaxID=3448133 RepID=UPI003EDE8606